MWIFTTYIQYHTDTQVVAEKKSTQWNSLTFKRQIKLLWPGQNVVGYTISLLLLLHMLCN